MLFPRNICALNKLVGGQTIESILYTLLCMQFMDDNLYLKGLHDLEVFSLWTTPWMLMFITVMTILGIDYYKRMYIPIREQRVWLCSVPYWCLDSEKSIKFGIKFNVKRKLQLQAIADGNRFFLCTFHSVKTLYSY